MANRIKLRRGADAPLLENLEDFELGYSIKENQLYIKVVEDDGNGNVERIIKKIPEINRNTEFTTTLTLKSSDVGTNPKQEFFITDSNLINKIAAIIDIDYLSENINDNYVKIFRNMDLVEDNLTENELPVGGTLNNTIKLKIRGSLPSRSDVGSGITIPIKVLVIK